MPTTMVHGPKRFCGDYIIVVCNDARTCRNDVGNTGGFYVSIKGHRILNFCQDHAFFPILSLV